MAGRRSTQRFDLAVIGADTAGLAAAGCAAVEGASVLVVKSGGEAPPALAGPGLPNAVWRLLGLHDAAVDLTPLPTTKTVSAAVLNGAGEPSDGAGASISADDAQTMRALEDVDRDAALVWRDFKASLETLNVTPARLRDALGPALNGSPLSTLNEYLDDYFDNDALKTHLAAQSLLSLGLAGDEPGSAAALGALSAGAWPARAASGGEVFRNALEKAVSTAGVTVVEGGIEALERLRPNAVEIKLRPGDVYQAKAAMASGLAVARASGFYPDVGYAPLSRFNGSAAYVRILFDDYPKAEGLQDGERCYVIDDREELADARDAMADGQVPERLPLMLELDHRAIIAYAPFCPDHLMDDGEPRPWSDQDRQALGRQVYDRIKERFGIKERPNAVDVRIDVSPAAREGVGPEDASLPTPSDVGDPVAAAVRLALEMIADE